MLSGTQASARRNLAFALARLAGEAGRSILQTKAEGIKARHKADRTVVTQADERSEILIKRGLAGIEPGVPVLAEEANARGESCDVSDAFFLVDPLDGTSEFADGFPDFAVLIALVEGGRPVVGVVHAPELGRYWVGGVGAGAWHAASSPGITPDERDYAPIHVSGRQVPRIAATSRATRDARTEAFLDELGIAERVRMGAGAKFGLVAEGSVDVYPRFSPVHEWDVAAGEAVITAAGGTVLTPAGGPLVYGKTAEDYLQPAFICWGRPPE